jgi:hypothetical protein
VLISIITNGSEEIMSYLDVGLLQIGVQTKTLA